MLAPNKVSWLPLNSTPALQDLLWILVSGGQVLLSREGLSVITKFGTLLPQHFVESHADCMCGRMDEWRTVNKVWLCITFGVHIRNGWAGMS